MFFMTFQWFLTIFAFYRMKKFQIVQFYAHLYLKRGLGPSLAPNCGPCIGPVLVEIVVKDITVSLTFNFSPPNHHVVVSEKGSSEFPSENAKFGHFWANRPTLCPHWDPLGRGLKSKCGVKLQLRLVLCHKVSHLGFYIHLGLHIGGKVQKKLICLYFVQCSIVKYP